MSRMGKHKESKVSIGFYATVGFKALLAYVVDQSGETATDIMMDGVRAKAERLGIMRDGKVLKEHAGAIKLLEAVFNAKKGKKGTKK